jgi:hypothetical protein
LLYALDLYASANGDKTNQTYLAALQRFAALEQELKGDALLELTINACSIIAWDDALRERWQGFAQGVCTVERLQAAKPEHVAFEALVLTMLPVAMTMSENREGFAESADQALTWLKAAERATAKSKKTAEKDFVAYVGVLMHNLNSFCLDAFDEPDAADDEIDAALKVLHRFEMRVGIATPSTPLRRQIIDSLFGTGRADDAKKMLAQMLARVDADPRGKTIALHEQAAILLQAAKLHFQEQADAAQVCTPDEDGVEI